MKMGSFEIVEYDEETGHMVVDMDGDTVKSLVSYGLNRLLEEYCEQTILEAKAKPSGDKTAEELEYGHQLKQEAAQSGFRDVENIPYRSMGYRIP